MPWILAGAVLGALFGALTASGVALLRRGLSTNLAGPRWLGGLAGGLFGTGLALVLTPALGAWPLIGATAVSAVSGSAITEAAAEMREEYQAKLDALEATAPRAATAPVNARGPAAGTALAGGELAPRTAPSPSAPPPPARSRGLVNVLPGP